jgi:hypothetical protein
MDNTKASKSIGAIFDSENRTPPVHCGETSGVLVFVGIFSISLFKVKSLQKKQRFLAHGNELSRKNEKFRESSIP